MYLSFYISSSVSYCFLCIYEKPVYFRKYTGYKRVFLLLCGRIVVFLIPRYIGDYPSRLHTFFATYRVVGVNNPSSRTYFVCRIKEDGKHRATNPMSAWIVFYNSKRSRPVRSYDEYFYSTDHASGLNIANRVYFSYMRSTRYRHCCVIHILCFFGVTIQSQ